MISPEKNNQKITPEQRLNLIIAILSRGVMRLAAENGPAADTPAKRPLQHTTKKGITYASTQTQ